MINQIYVFPNGSRINLKKVVAIGTIEKTVSGNIYFDVYTDNSAYPIKFMLGYAIGTADEKVKENVKTIYSSFCKDWEEYLIQNKNPD